MGQEKNSSPVHSNSEASDSMFKKVAIVISIGFGCGLIAIFMLFNEEQSTPYMDEIFHVRQTQNYCKGNFSYVSILNFIFNFYMYFNFNFNLNFLFFISFLIFKNFFLVGP